LYLPLNVVNRYIFANAIIYASGLAEPASLIVREKRLC